MRPKSAVDANRFFANLSSVNFSGLERGGSLAWKGFWFYFSLAHLRLGSC
jgi:hypothetical protein